MTTIEQVWHTIQATPCSPAQRLAMLVDDYFHAQIDRYGFLQLTTNCLGPDTVISPLAPFFRQFRDQVRQSYPTARGLRVDEQGRQIHLFRAYLDLLYLNYLHHYRGHTDYERLLNFAKDHQLKLDYSTNARYHNRYQTTFAYPQHMKVQLVRNSWARHENPARMIELIIDIDTEQFVSEWRQYQWAASGQVVSDPAQYRDDQLAEVANTESFNYGIPHGQYWLWPKDRRSHQYLDVLQPTDNQLRQLAKQRWRAPRRSEYVDLVRTGEVDVRCWQGMPVETRPLLYNDFLNYLRRYQGPNWGINYYCQSTSRYQYLAVKWKRRPITRFGPSLWF